MDLLKGIGASLLAVIVVGFGLTIGVLISIGTTILTVLGGLIGLVVALAYAIYDAITSNSPSR